MTTPKEKAKKPLLALLLLSLAFYGGMLLLSVFADEIHYARLPQVTAQRPQKQSFTSMITYDEEYTTTQTSQSYALPKDMVDSDQVFIIQTVNEDNFTYYYAKKVQVIIDTEKDNPGYYAVSGGISSRDSVILTGYETLRDGDEVYPQTEKKEATKIPTENLFE